jgi:hypothetical protein
MPRPIKRIGHSPQIPWSAIVSPCVAGGNRLDGIVLAE